MRARLGGGSPNTIAPLLAEWKSLHEYKQAASLPPVPEPVEAVLRQVWGAAWQQAQGQLSGEREALAVATCNHPTAEPQSSRFLDHIK